jgi:ABC-2 type transport system permease protein
MNVVVEPSLRLTPRPKYVALAFIAIQRALTYRWTLILNILSRVVWLALSYFLWAAVFASQIKLGGFDWLHMKTYIIIAYAVNTLFYSSSTVYRMMTLITTGDIILELIRPTNIFNTQLAQALGSMVIEGIISCFFVLFIGSVIDILPPASLLASILFIVSIVLGFLIKFLIHFLVVLLCFWTINWFGIYTAETAIVNFFSGALLPLSFFPPWLNFIASILPFQSIVYTPVAIYLGSLQGSEITQALVQQGIWIAVLRCAIWWLWSPSLRALDIQRG